MARKSDKLLLNSEPCCKPLDTYDEIISFPENPPSWRSLCKEITPHSKDKIRNMSMNSLVGAMSPDRPPTFCHFNPDSEDVVRQSADSLPKTLVCHDMANGYHDDSMIDGTPNDLAYTFYHWGGIDIFCYFSHHLVTIPPLGWINVGHAHGVKVIGTLITEWSEGFDFWEFVLSSQGQYEELADALVAITKLLKFDGWLLNIENKISQPLVLVEFVKCLRRKLHEALPGALVIWYDSVTVKGNLNWQNGLNDNNKLFFDACDGIFTNYSWKEEDVASSAEAAGERLHDLYIGIDVWGRNFYGGGQFNTAEAVDLVSSYGCSLAIFAPAWTYEAAARREADAALAHLRPGALRELRERALWGALWAFLSTRLPRALPFQTSFCRGHGHKRRLYGEVLSPGPWYNLRHMQYQPNAAYGPHGYLLSTPETINVLSRHSMVRDKKGIIKFLAAFHSSRQELHAVRSARELEAQREHHDSLLALAAARRDSPASPASPDSPDSPDDDKRHSMRNVFKHIFRMKRRRPEEAAGKPQTSHDDKTDDQLDKDLDQHDKMSDESIKSKGQMNLQIRDDLQDKTDVDSLNKARDEQDKTSDKFNDRFGDKISDRSSDKTSDRASSVKANVIEDKPNEQYDKPHHVQIRDDLQSRDREESSGKTFEESARSAASLHDLKEGWSLRNMSVHIKLGGGLPRNARLALACVPGEAPCLEPYYEDSYNGGSCLRVNPSDEMVPEHRWTRLFHCEFPCEGDLVVCVVTKTLPEYENQYLNVKLFARDRSHRELRVTCVNRTLPQAHGAGARAAALAAAGALTLYPLAEGDELTQLQKYLLLNEPGFYMSVENSFGWKVRYFLAPLGSNVVTSINLHCGLSTGPVLLGHIGLCHRREVAEDYMEARPRPAHEASVSISH